MHCSTWRLGFGSFSVSALRWIAMIAVFAWCGSTWCEMHVSAAEDAAHYDTLKENAEVGRRIEEVRATLRGNNFSGDQQKLFDSFFTDFFFARWTTNPAALTGKGLFRPELRIYFRTTGAGEVYNRLNALTLETMKKFVAGNYHPAVRVNAALTIGELNVDDRNAKPLPAALKELTAIALNAKYSYAIRDAAMVGVVRHAHEGVKGLDDDSAKLLTASLLSLAKAEWPKDASNAGQTWLFARTIESLGLLGAVGEQNAIYNVILKAADDASLPLFVRAQAVESLGNLRYAGTSGIKPAETVAVLARFTVAVCDDELQRLDKLDDKIDAQLPRRMISSLNAVLFAINGDGVPDKGIAPLAQDAAKTSLAALQKAVVGARLKFEDKKNDGEDLSPDVKTLREQADGLAK